MRELIRRAGAGEFVRCDFEVLGALGGETIIIDFSLLPIRNENGEIVFYCRKLAISLRRKRAEAEIARKNQELQASQVLISRQRDELQNLYNAVVAEQKVSERLLLSLLPIRLRND
ncbi:hypothetical protein ACTMU2_17860 [Cupriavidus basilensis]